MNLIMPAASKLYTCQVRLGAAREVYRPVAARGALMYFLIDSLPALDRTYYFSMATFVAILQKGVSMAICRKSVSCLVYC